MTPDEVREELRAARRIAEMFGDDENTHPATRALVALADMVQRSIDQGASVGPDLAGVVAS